MKTRCLLFVICSIFLCFSKQAFCKDRYVQKCERWKTLRKYAAGHRFEILSDESAFFRQDPSKEVLKIQLHNGIQALLISDPLLEESAAALAVGVGTWDDPDEFPGMAHFVEHLLFLGTEAYPNEFDYSQFILERGGQYNAFTKHDRTIYGFSIPNQSFSGALDRLSHFFINPLITLSAIEREIYAVHHEFEDAVENDSLRVWRVLKESGNPNHPNVKLSCGNLESLSKVKRKDVLDWIESKYQPEKMRLVLMSSEPLESLAENASRFFSKIPSRGKTRKYPEREVRESMTSLGQRGNLIHVTPSFKNRSLFLMWEIPSYFLTLENNKAVQLLQMALDHGQSNSLSKILEKESLAQEVHVEFWKIAQDHAFFIINIVLTEDGTLRYEEVIERCFQALNRLKEIKIPQHLLDRLEYIESSHLVRSFENIFDYAMRISSELLDEDLLTYPDKTSFVPVGAFSKVYSFLRELTPFQCLYFLVASPEEVGVYPSKIEKWMGSEYFIRKISEEKLLKWNVATPHPMIGIQTEDPTPSSKDSPVFNGSEVTESVPADPVFVVDNELARIRWIQQSGESNLVDAFFCITTSSLTSSARHMALNDLFVFHLKESLKETFETNPNIAWNLEMEGADLCLFFSVPNGDQLISNFSLFFNTLKKTTPSEEKFYEYKKKKLDSYPGDPSPIDYAHQILDSFLRPFYYTKMELYHALVDLSFEEYKKFHDTYLSHVFLEGAFLGGANESQILKLCEEIFAILEMKSQDPIKERPKQFEFPGEEQSYLVLQKTHRKGNALLLLVDAGEVHEDVEALHKILTIVLQSEFFEELRTRQQTAYRLYTWNEAINQRVYHCFGLQSSTHSSVDLLRRIDLFLDRVSELFPRIFPRERFEIVKQTLVSNEERQKKVVDRQEDLDLINARIESLMHLDYNEVIAKTSEVFSEGNRRRIAILVEGNEKIQTKTEDFYGIPYIPIEKERFYN